MLNTIDRVLRSPGLVGPVRGERLDIGELFESARRPFVSQEFGPSDERDVPVPKPPCHPTGPGLVPGNPAERAHDVDLDRLDAHRGADS